MESQLRHFDASRSAKKNGELRNSTLILVAFASVFFPRFFVSFGAPSAINFAHFVIVPSVFLIAVLTTKTRDRKSAQTVAQLSAGLLILLICLLISGLLNDAGAVNIFLEFMLQAEPFMFLAAILAVPMHGKALTRFRNWLLGFALVNLLLAIAQSVLLPIGLYPKPQGGTLQDNIVGVFGGGGGSAANYISCTISLYFGLYFFNNFKQLSLVVRLLPLIGALYQTQVSDSKQVFLAVAVGWGLLAATKVKRPAKLLMYLLVAIVAILIFRWALLNLNAAFLRPYQNWIHRPIWGWDGLAAETKFAAFRIIPTYFESPLNWFFGLGPGHGVSRLGGWILRDYEALLLPLGATTHPATAEVWQVVSTSYLPQESTIYFPLYTWPGIWGDIGIAGLGAFLYLCSIAWQRVCVDDFGRFLLLSTASFGWILTQMEDPGQLLTVACLMALQWQATREKQLAFGKTGRF